MNLVNNPPSSYHKIVENVPNFHRIIDEDTSKLYPSKAIKHAYYFFEWNEDPFTLFPLIMDRWKIIKFLSGFHLDEYEGNTPVDGIVDRIQVIHYPSGVGEMEAHSDPYKHQKLAIGGIFSKKEEDYMKGVFLSQIKAIKK